MAQIENSNTVAVMNGKDIEVPDIYELSKNRDNATLTDEQYIRLSEYAATEVRRLCSNLSLWTPYNTKDGYEIFERKSDLPEASENMLLLITTLPCSMEKLEKLVSPWLEYRAQWDKMLESAEVITTWPEQEIFFVRHLIKKLYTISARESLDIVKVSRRENEVVFGSTGGTHANYPPCKGFVRTHQYLGGYVMRPDDSDPGHTKFYMLFHADLNIGGPRFLANMLAKFKPTLMMQKMDNLKEAITQFDI